MIDYLEPTMNDVCFVIWLDIFLVIHMVKYSKIF